VLRPNMLRNTLIIVLSFYMLLSYQNCGENAKFNPQLVDSSPDLETNEFLSKIAEDADVIWGAGDQALNPSCKFRVPECGAEEDVTEACVAETVSAYYDSLECAGFDVYEGNDCLVAISSSTPTVMEPVLLDITCFNIDSQNKKALNLGMCYGEDIGFSKEAPSTGMRISAWAELGDEYPYSRQIRQLVFYPNQEDVKMVLHEMGVGSEVKDACGKVKQAQPLDLVIPVEVKDFSVDGK